MLTFIPPETSKSIVSLRVLLLLTLVITLAISTVSARFLAQFLRDDLLHRDAVLTQELVQSIAYAQNATAYFDPGEGSEHQSVVLENFFKQVVHLPDVVRANVFATDGHIIWSNQSQLIGQQFANNDELRQALSGALMVEIGRLETTDKAEHILFEWQFEQWFVESYIPIRDRGVVVGVIELYKIPQTLSDTIAKSTLIVWISAVLVGLLLFVVVYVLLVRKSATSSRSAAADTSNNQSRPTEHPVVDSASPDRGVLDASDTKGTTQRRRWAAALGLLTLALFGPVVFGGSVLYVYGVADDAPFNSTAQANPSPLGFMAGLVAWMLDTTPPVQPPVAAATLLDAPVAVEPVATASEDSRTNNASSTTTPVQVVGSPPVSAATAIMTPKTSATAASAANSPKPLVLSSAERLFWQSVTNQQDIALYQSYLEQFPHGVFVSIAENKIKQAARRKAQQIDIFLTKARQALYERKALTTPADDNAVKWAEAALRIEPDNRAAQQLLSAVIDTYLDWSRRGLRQNKPARAALYMQRAHSLQHYASAEQRATLATVDQALQP